MNLKTMDMVRVAKLSREDYKDLNTVEKCLEFFIDTVPNNSYYFPIRGEGHKLSTKYDHTGALILFSYYKNVYALGFIKDVKEEDNRIVGVYLEEYNYKVFDDEKFFELEELEGALGFEIFDFNFNNQGWNVLTGENAQIVFNYLSDVKGIDLN
ncbi:hypothetical protein [Ureibacillus manganicus]|nr:hypothetical protein [Ureibacillus manganicus]